jgi:hypothetical protein
VRESRQSTATLRLGRLRFAFNESRCLGFEVILPTLGKCCEYHRTYTSICAAEHWAREAGILAPLIISELAEDGEKKWRYIRLASTATALFFRGTSDRKDS